MRRLVRPKPLMLILSVIALIVLVAVGQYQRLFERSGFNVQALWQPMNTRSIGLDQYQVAIEARVIDGLDDDVSALTFDPVRKSLFTVTQKRRADRVVPEGKSCGVWRWSGSATRKQWSSLALTLT